MTTLDELADRYELANEISAQYAYTLRYASRRYAAHLGRSATVDDLEAASINRWLVAEQRSAELGARSRANLRRSIVTLWRSHDDDADGRPIRRVSVPDRNPTAWTVEETRLVAAAADELPGRLSTGVPRRIYFRCIIWFVFETGLRRGDVWSFDSTSFGPDRTVAVTQSKSQRSHVIQVSRPTFEDMAAIARVLKIGGHDSRCPLYWPHDTKTFYRWFRRAREAAGVDGAVGNRALQHLRRTGATQVASDGKEAWRYLGHAAGGLDRKAYVDATQVIRPVTPSAGRAG